MKRYFDFFSKINLFTKNELDALLEHCSFLSKRNDNLIEIIIEIKKLPSPKIYFSILDKLHKTDESIVLKLSTEKLNLSIDSLNDYLIFSTSISSFYEKNIMFNIFKRKNIQLENNKLIIYFLNKNEEFVLQKNYSEILNFFSLGGFNIFEIEFLLDEKQKEVEQYKYAKEEESIKAVLNQQKIAKENIIKNKKIFNSSNYNYGIAKGQVEKIIDLVEEQGTAIVQGEVFSIDIILTRTGMKIFKFFISDDTDSLLIKIFPREKTMPINVVENIKIGDIIKAKINLSRDQYENNDLTGIVQQLSIIENSQNTNVVKNNSNLESRVELINHTNMTSFEGLITLDGLINKVIADGSKYLSITDKYNCQSFPDAWNLSLKYPEITFMYGIQLEVLDDPIKICLNDDNSDFRKKTFVVFDLETTGLSPYYDEIIEFGAVKYRDGFQVEQIQFFIDPKKPIPKKISLITKIYDEDVQGKETIDKALDKILNFIGDSILVAHNGINFDLQFLNCKLSQNNRPVINNQFIDSMLLSRALNEDLNSHSLGGVCKKYWIEYDEEIAHRADFDANVLLKVWIKMLEELENRKINSTFEINTMLQNNSLKSRTRGELVTIYCPTQKYLRDFYKMISLSLTENLYGSPKILRRNLEIYKDKFLIVNSPTEGDVWQKAIGSTQEDLEHAICQYDYILISPPSCFLHEIHRGILSKESIEDALCRIIFASKKFNKKIIASSDSYYLEKSDKQYFNVYVFAKSLGGKRHRFFKYNDSNEVMPDLHYRSTNEMISEFDFLDKKLVQEIVVTNSKLFAENFKDKIQTIKNTLCSPKIEGAEEKLINLINNRMLEIFGKNVDNFIRERVEFETRAVVDNGFAVIYWFSHLLVKKSMDDGFFVGSRGSVGSSLTAWLINISEVNPLPAHYLCKKCKFFELHKEIESGFDLPNILCKNCGSEIQGDGHNIPFETFMGFDGDKTPDIDLNFSALYQSKAHDFIRDLFGKDRVFRAGTISTVAEKTAFGYVKAYFDDIGKENVKNAQIKKIVSKCKNVKRTTGQHPGGIIVIPQEYDIYDFTPFNYPADDKTLDWFTTHFPFESLHDCLLKFDILGHDNPTVLKMLTEQTNIDANNIPNYDPEVMKLFYSNESLKMKYLDLSDIIKVGTNGIPEFGTNFVKEMLLVTKPKKFSDLIRISGLSHGTQVWTNNAKTLIESNNIDISEVVSCRDDIMVYLVSKGVDSLTAFKIMEDVRKGKKLSSDYKKKMADAKVPNWYIDSCEKIAYLFPKAHATAYVIMAWKIAWFKIHYPLHFYSSYFSIRTDVFDIVSIVQGKDVVLTKYNEIRKKLSNPATKFLVKNKEIDLLGIYEIVLEMYSRGYSIKNIDLNKSDISNFIVEGDHLIPPFSTIDGLGETVARSIVEARNGQPFLSKEDLAKRTKLTRTHLKILSELGVINHLNEDDQLAMFI